jgi:hypothetical protein
MFSSGSMNLGAPVLAFETAVLLDATSGSSTTYSPVSIVTPTYAQSNMNNPNVFSPDLSIVAKQEVTFKNQTLQVEIAPETVVKTETVYVDTSVQSIVRVSNPKDLRGPIIAAVSVSVLALLLAAYCLRYFFLRKTQERLDAERDIRKIAESKRMNELTMAKLKDVNMSTDKKYNQVEADSTIYEP